VAVTPPRRAGRHPSGHAQRTLDRIGRRQGPPQCSGNTQPHHCHRLLQALLEARRCVRVPPVQPPRPPFKRRLRGQPPGHPLLLGDDGSGWGETRLAFEESVARRGPDAFYSLKKGIESVYGALGVEPLLAWPRFSGWDSRVFVGCAPALVDAAPALEE